ncbi:hypothetical protein VTO73DRAFT_11865 [Trametes versicolor]
MPLEHEVSYDIPSELYPGGHDGFEHYVILQQELCYDYRKPTNFRKLWVNSLQMIKDCPGDRLEKGLREQDAPLMLEHCLRTLSLCEIDISLSSAGDVGDTLRRITGLAMNSPHPRDAELPEVKNNSPLVQLCALSACAYLHFYGHWLIPNSGSLHSIKTSHDVHNAAFTANACIQNGFVPPIALHIASWLRTGTARFGLDVCEIERFKKLEYLWKAHDEYLAGLHALEALRLKKIEAAPHLYRCANDGCDIRAYSKSALRRCGGDCPPERKAHYCSEYCQRRHWTIHREFCKGDNDYADIIDDDGNPDWVDVDGFLAPAIPDHDFKRNWPLWAEREGAEIFIDINNDSPYRRGQVLRIRTKTLSPECLKAYKRLWTSPFSQITRGVVYNSVLLDPPDNMGFPR